MLTIKVTPADNLQNILDNLSSPATIYLSKGIYRQKIKVSVPDVTLIGEERETTVITWDDYARKIHTDGMEYNTFRTYTVCVTGNNVRFENFTIENSNADPSSAGQCVALSVNSRTFSAKNMRLVSTQDTLFLSPFPDDLIVRYAGITAEGYYDGFIPRDELYMEGSTLHFFENCEIYGSVDFIFGCAEAYFYRCRLISVYDGRDESYVAAPAHSLKQERGFLFCDCEFLCGGVADDSVYLARPWRDFGKCDFINCKLGRHVNSKLFDKWNDTARDKTARFSYGGLDSERSVSPVKWSNKLTDEQSDELLSRCMSAKKKFEF